jgi:hypothetical protein
VKMIAQLLCGAKVSGQLLLSVKSVLFGPTMFTLLTVTGAAPALATVKVSGTLTAPLVWLPKLRADGESIIADSELVALPGVVEQPAKPRAKNSPTRQKDQVRIPAIQNTRCVSSRPDVNLDSEQAAISDILLDSLFTEYPPRFGLTSAAETGPC